MPIISSQKMQSTNAPSATSSATRTNDLKQAHQENTLLQAQLSRVSNDAQSLPPITGGNKVPEMSQATPRRRNPFSRVRNLWTTYLSPCFGMGPRLSDVQVNAKDNVQVNAKDNDQANLNKAHSNLNYLTNVFTENFNDFLQHGIFRVSGNANEMIEIKESLRTQGTLGAEGLPDVYSICAVIKQTLSLAMSNDDLDQMSANLKHFIKEGDKENVEFLQSMELPKALKTVLPLLGRLALDNNSRVTEMPASNLAVCFAPNCFPAPVTISIAIIENQNRIELIENLIKLSQIRQTPQSLQ